MITPPSSARAIEAALSQNPDLTSLPLPHADILAPESLSQTSGTAEILRIPEVREAITGDFVVLPCDLVCEVPGELLLDSWMTHQAGLGGVAAQGEEYAGPRMGVGGEGGGRRGGLGVWYSAKGEGSSKHDETDFLIIAQLERPPSATSDECLSTSLRQMVYSTTKDTLGDIIEEKEGLPLRTRLLETYGKLKILSNHRDAHIYFFPHWVLDMVKNNKSFDTVSEDLIGWWAKSVWQPGLGCITSCKPSLSPPRLHEHGNAQGGSIEDTVDIATMSSTQNGRTASKHHMTSAAHTSGSHNDKDRALVIPPILGYIHSSEPTAPLIRRVDTASLLLNVSLRLAKLPSVDDLGHASASPFAHPNKVKYPEGIAQRTTINRSDSLVAENVSIESKCNIKESVIGANCQIKTGCRLTRCLLMDGVVVGERCELTGCVVGRRAQVGKACMLVDCEIQDGNAVAEGTEAKGEKYMVFEGLEEESGGGDDDGLDPMAEDSSEVPG